MKPQHLPALIQQAEGGVGPKPRQAPPRATIRPDLPNGIGQFDIDPGTQGARLALKAIRIHKFLIPFYVGGIELLQKMPP